MSTKATSRGKVTGHARTLWSQARRPLTQGGQNGPPSTPPECIKKILELLSDYFTEMTWDDDLLKRLKDANIIPKEEPKSGTQSFSYISHHVVNGRPGSFEKFVGCLIELGPGKCGIDLHRILCALRKVQKGVADDINDMLNKHTRSYVEANNPRREIELLLTMYTTARIAMSMKDIEDRDSTIDELTARLKIREEELEKAKNEHEQDMEKVRRAWDKREEEYKGVVKVAKEKLEELYTTAKKEIANLEEENRSYHKDVCGLFGMTKVNNETGEDSSTDLKN